jgi:RNA polymerase sigma factor (sigma-70 family)
MEASAAPRPALPKRAGLIPPRLLRVASDERLVALVRQGSQPAFEILYDRHNRGILSFCRHMLGSREEAEDALQHTFMAAYRDMVGSEKDIQLRAWLYAIARNRCLTVLRSRRDKPVDELDEVPTEGLATAVERRQDLQDLLRDLAGLPEDQRAALVLAEIGDMPHDDIAAVIGCPKEKVKALVFQARTSLHSSREARETSCEDIREMLSSLRGGSLRRTSLRRHLNECAGCREFHAEVKRQRSAMAVLLPVAPSIGLKDSVLAAVFSSQGAAAGGAAAGAGAAAVASSGTAAGGASGGAALAAKALVVLAAVGGGTAGVKAVSDGDATKPRAVAAKSDAKPAPSPPPSPVKAVAPVATEEGSSDEATKERTKSAPARRRGKSDRGKANRGKPTTRGTELARTRGKGLKRGLNGTQPGKLRKQNAAGHGQSVERKQAAKQKRATSRAKKRAVRRAKRHAVPQRRIKKQTRTQTRPRPAPAPAPKPKPETTPEPTPTATPTPEPLLPDPDPGKPHGRQ